MKISDVTIKPSITEKIFYWVSFDTYVRNFRTSEEHSQVVNQLLDDPNTELIIEDEYTILLGGLRLWAHNYPFAYGSIWDDHYFETKVARRLPNRATVFRLRQVVEAAKFSLGWQQGNVLY